MRKFTIGFFFFLPIAATLVFINAAFIQGNTGFKVGKTQKGLLVSKVLSPINSVQKNDLIIAANGLSHDEVLGNLILQQPLTAPGSFTVLRGGQVIELSLKTEPYTLFSLLKLIWPRLMLIAVMLVLGALVIYKHAPDDISLLFYFMLCSFASSLSATLPSAIVFFNPMVYSFSFLLHTPFNWIAFGLWLHFALKFPEERDLVKNRWWLPAIIYLIPAVTTIGGAFFAAGWTPEFFGWVQRLRNLYLPLIIITVFLKHASDYKKIKTQQERNRIKLPLIAYWLAFGPYLFFYLLPNLLIDSPLISFRIAVFGFFALPLAYYAGILRYKLFKVDQIISKTIAYVAIIMALTVIYSLFFTALKKWFFGDALLSKEVFLVFLILMNMIFHPVILKLDQLIRRLFFRSDAISIKTMHEFSHRIAATLELPRIINAIIRKLPEAIHVSSIAVMIFEGNRSRLFPPTLRFGSSLWRKSRMADRFKDTAITHFSVFQVLQDPDLEKELQEIQKAGFTLVLPLRSSRALSGFLFIGPKAGGSLFNEADILLLGSFANQATIALENALHHESLLKGKQQLEQMFEQKVQAEKMAAIGEMTSLLAHELKNPLGIIHSSAQYLAKGKQSRQVTEEMVAYIIDEVDHLNLSINSILNFARQKPPELARVNLEQEIKTLMDQWIHTKDHRRTVTIQIDAASKLPPVYVDFRQLAQVLLNLIRNSEEMMADGGKINIHLEQMRDHVHIRIIDNGPGISHENQDKVFDNFFTTKNQGLGLGLSACRQIIQAHNGSIFLTNRTDNDQSGASALIKLPVRPLENIQKSSMLKMLPT